MDRAGNPSLTPREASSEGGIEAGVRIAKLLGGLRSAANAGIAPTPRWPLDDRVVHRSR